MLVVSVPRRGRVPANRSRPRTTGALVATALAPLAMGVTAPRAWAQGAAPPGTPAASLAGVVYDSLAGRPLAGAVVQVVRAADLRAGVTTVTADSLGRFAVGGLAPGRYLVGFAHPALDPLAAQVPPRAVDIVDAGTAGTLALAIPGPARLRDALCPALVAGDSSGAVAGAVRDAGTGTPAGDAVVTLAWNELVVTSTGLRKEQRRVATSVRPDGTFLVCGVPSDGAVEATATAPRRESGAVEVTAPARGLAVQGFALGPAGPAPAGVPAGSPGDATPAPAAGAAGTARLTGRVVGPDGAPVRGARLRLRGTAAEAETRGDGTFALAGLPAGTRSLDVRAVGKQPTSVAVDLAAGRAAEVRVALPPAVPVLERVVVKGTATRRSAILEQVLARKRTGQGRYYMRAEIDRIVAFDVTDVIRMNASPGLRVEVVPRHGRGGVLRSVLRGRQGCRPTVYVDGAVVSDGADEINDIVQPASIMAMEVYAGPSTVPAMFNATGSGGSLQGGGAVPCGAVLVWTWQ